MPIGLAKVERGGLVLWMVKSRRLSAFLAAGHCGLGVVWVHQERLNCCVAFALLL